MKVINLKDDDWPIGAVLNVKQYNENDYFWSVIEHLPNIILKTDCVIVGIKEYVDGQGAQKRTKATKIQKKAKSTRVKARKSERFYMF